MTICFTFYFASYLQLVYHHLSPVSHKLLAYINKKFLVNVRPDYDWFLISLYQVSFSQVQ